mgnify:CR=1 FL=1
MPADDALKRVPALAAEMASAIPQALAQLEAKSRENETIATSLAAREEALKAREAAMQGVERKLAERETALAAREKETAAREAQVKAAAAK